MMYYVLLCILRIILVILPQSGYIHPDEHFQGPEIVYGDISGYNVLRTWEFSSVKPIRSIFFPYTVAGIPAIMTYVFNFLHFKPNAYLLVTLPRLIMCMLSFVQDVYICKICNTMNRNYKLSLTVFASSYVTFTYLTRTFSNSFESLLFAFLMFLLSKILHLQNELNNGRTPDLFLKKFMINSFMCGLAVTLGCFNRPTFVCFSIFPMIMWCFTLFHVNIFTKINFFIAFLLGVFSVNICITAIDTLYYNKFHYSAVHSFNIIHTPLNFISYNLNMTNLESHGLHPRWLHILVNIPLLFSVYGITLIYYSVKKVFSLFRNFQLNSEIILLLSFFVPLILLSAVPHQEPRFLIPLIIPLSILFGGQQLGSYLQKKFCIYLWIICNILCLLFYGFIHQAGIYLSMHYINSQIDNNTTIIFYKTYMPPRYLLPLESNRNIYIFDFAGSQEVVFKSALQDALNYKPSKLIFIVPYEMSNLTLDALSRLNYKFTQKTHCFPHLSMENLPRLSDILYVWKKNSLYLNKLYDLKEIFSIHIISYKKHQVI